MGRYAMIKKLSGCLVVCALAAWCPAPIVDKSPYAHKLHVQTPQEQLENQKYNGNVGVVGVVPEKTNEDGTGPAPIDDSVKAAANVLAAGSPEMTANAVRNLTVAQQNLKLDNQGGSSNSPIFIILFLAAIAGAMFGIKTWLDKNGPAPKPFTSAENSVD